MGTFRPPVMTLGCTDAGVLCVIFQKCKLKAYLLYPLPLVLYHPMSLQLSNRQTTGIVRKENVRFGNVCNLYLACSLCGEYGQDMHMFEALSSQN